MRRRVKRRIDKAIFRRTANRVKKANLVGITSRGGIRL